MYDPKHDLRRNDHSTTDGCPRPSAYSYRRRAHRHRFAPRTLRRRPLGRQAHGRSTARSPSSRAARGALDRTKPWEGNASGYTTVFQDGDLYRMYYRGFHIAYSDGESEATNREVICYAESRDGIHWKRPRLGLVESHGSKENNIIWDGVGSHNFSVFKDANPACPREFALQGARRTPLERRGPAGIPVRRRDSLGVDDGEPSHHRGRFRLAERRLLDTLRNEYRAYWRDSRKDDPKYLDGRDIRTATSKDFVHWSESEFLEYTPGRPHQLYTNGVVPYHRAPHIFLGFPTRYVDYGWSESTQALPQLDYRRVVASKSQRSGTAMTDGVFMASRDGHNFELWPEAFRRPGIERPGSWFYGDNYGNWGLVETPSSMEGAPNELSIYASEGGRQPDGNRLRRYTLRLDGFVSVQAPFRRWRADHAAARLRGQRSGAQLFDVHRGQYSRRASGLRRRRDRRFHAGRLPADLRRHPSAHDCLETGLRCEQVIRQADSPPFRIKRRGSLLVAVQVDPLPCWAGSGCPRRFSLADRPVSWEDGDTPVWISLFCSRCGRPRRASEFICFFRQLAVFCVWPFRPNGLQDGPASPFAGPTNWPERTHKLSPSHSTVGVTRRCYVRRFLKKGRLLKEECDMATTGGAGPKTGPERYRSIDGTGNNLTHHEWGSAGQQLLRLTSVAYGDGISTPAGEGCATNL